MSGREPENGLPEPSAVGIFYRDKGTIPWRVHSLHVGRGSADDCLQQLEGYDETESVAVPLYTLAAAERVIRERVAAEIEGEAYVLECVEDGVGASFQAAQHLRRAARRVRSRNEGGA